jgi:chemotaxis protein MotA
VERRADIGSLIGLGLALLGIIGAQWIEGGSIASLAQLAAFLIVVCGTLGAVMLQSPNGTFLQGVRMLPWVVMPPPPRGRHLMRVLGRWSNLVRREGLLSLESELENSDNDQFMKNGLQMLVDGWEADRMREALDIEITTYEERLRGGAQVWESAGGYAPTIGILGAVLGLIHVMEHLSEPARLGAGIAVAFVATIYGVGLANLVLLPTAHKLRVLTDGLVRERELIADGLVSVARGENPKLIEQRLAGYLN